MKNHQRFALIFIGCVVTLLGGFLYFRAESTVSWEVASETFYSLHDIYRVRGIGRFLEEKKQLRNRVAKVLEDKPGTEQGDVATNIATFLFPDLLPNSNFEKETANTLWAPFENAIEKEPRTPQSRRHFEEMRANIWNYENPNRIFPTLSPYAKQVIRIYDELSSQ